MGKLVALIIMAILSGCNYHGIPEYSGEAKLTRLNPNTHVVWGDSLAWQASNYGAADMVYNGYIWHNRPGLGLTDLQEEILQDLNNLHPVTMTLALGTNDAGFWDGRDGWTATDEAAWTRILDAAGATKIVIVLPWVEAGLDVGFRDLQSVELARDFLRSQVYRPNVTIVDWRDYVGPGVLDQGGIHVRAGQEGLRYQATVAGDPL